MDGSLSVVGARDDAREVSMAEHSVPTRRDIQREFVTFSTRANAMLQSLERTEPANAYQAQIARALLGSLMDALSEIDPAHSG